MALFTRVRLRRAYRVGREEPKEDEESEEEGESEPEEAEEPKVAIE